MGLSKSPPSFLQPPKRRGARPSPTYQDLKNRRHVCFFWKACNQADVPPFARDVAVRMYTQQALTSFLPDEMHLVLCGRVVLKFFDRQDLVAGLSKAVKPLTANEWARKEWGLLNRLKWNITQFYPEEEEEEDSEMVAEKSVSPAESDSPRSVMSGGEQEESQIKDRGQVMEKSAVQRDSAATANLIFDIDM